MRVVEVVCFSDDEDDEQTGSTYEISNDKLNILARVSGMVEGKSPSLVSETSSYATAGSATGSDALCDAMTIMRLPNSLVEHASSAATDTLMESDNTSALRRRSR